MFYVCEHKGCAGRSTANSALGIEVEPVQALYNTIPEKALPIIADLIEYVTEEISPFPLKQPLIDAIDGVNGDVAPSLTEFATDLNRAFGCEPITDAYLGFKDVFCCDFLSVFYFYVWPWYLMAFALVFCGWPAGCCASKRLRNVKRSREVVLAAVVDGQEHFQTRMPIASGTRTRRRKYDDLPVAVSGEEF
uniref:Uncharacterized protein n=1 Tax=Aplanochytrium stocchinoi TaxID=215587 RepID=A0A7S3PJA3_9STRA|mmetsp:Transcript_997/g.1265  ORF Transcript_997/g.1265 Transcript_997/m.1265 type:complete len:192 (+) Transcript_997:751-1326(+)